MSVYIWNGLYKLKSLDIQYIEYIGDRVILIFLLEMITNKNKNGIFFKLIQRIDKIIFYTCIWSRVQIYII